MTTLKKIILDDGYEYLDPTPLFNEMDTRSFKIFVLARCICDVLNYYQENTPDAFGNAPYARLCGYMEGFINGGEMELERGKDLWIVRKGKRKILAVEVPTKPQGYYEAIKDNAKTIRQVFGG